VLLAAVQVRVPELALDATSRNGRLERQGEMLARISPGPLAWGDPLVFLLIVTIGVSLIREDLAKWPTLSARTASGSWLRGRGDSPAPRVLEVLHAE